MIPPYVERDIREAMAKATSTLQGYCPLHNCQFCGEPATVMVVGSHDMLCNSRFYCCDECRDLVNEKGVADGIRRV